MEIKGMISLDGGDRERFGLIFDLENRKYFSSILPSNIVLQVVYRRIFTNDIKNDKFYYGPMQDISYKNNFRFFIINLYVIFYNEKEKANFKIRFM